MGDKWLILDCPFLAYRSAFAMGGLSFDGSQTSVVFGLMRDLIGWKDLFQTDKIVFCFDWGRNKRLEIYPEYKANRRERKFADEGEEEKWITLKRQVSRLAEEDLFALGFRNVLYEDGYEADDLIASVVVSSLPEGDEAVIITSDADLYQLIGPTVSMYNPIGGKKKSYQWFCREYGIEPCDWADVKAVAGCSGDNVKGITGVGEKSVLKFLNGTLTGKRREEILNSVDMWKKNLRLVRLPFEGTPTFELHEDKITKERWKKFCEKYGLRSLKELYPGR